MNDLSVIVKNLFVLVIYLFGLFVKVLHHSSIWLIFAYVSNCYQYTCVIAN
ncbi:unnamed protein product [Coffea canephora]|uniref:Uncharacterized protein n=1 Tax=Coffea canephora TaxID=49390 RepID=A0A068U7V3_COFCA|nr:unnamed protein product [Coffea canephora]